MRTSQFARRRSRAQRRGFTLIEILLVLGILVVMGSIVGVSVLTMQANAYNRAAKTQLHAFDSAITQYQLDIGQPPATLDALVNPPDDLPNPDKWKGPYLPKAVPMDPWDQAYNYEPNGDQFRIYSSGKDRVAQTNDDVNL